jgi:predicted secreted acid phosphatase
MAAMSMPLRYPGSVRGMLRRVTALATALAVLVAAGLAAVALAAPPAPPQPRDVVVAYYDSGAYTRDTVPQLARARTALLEGLKQLPRGRKAAIVLDIDDTSLSQYRCRKPGDLPFNDAAQGVACVQSAALTPIVETRALYRLALRRGVAVFFITGRVPSMRAATLKNLREAGYARFTRLYLRPTADLTAPSVVPYKAGRRKAITRAGYRILVNVGDQLSDLDGGYARRSFKLPNPMYLIP